MIPDPKYKPGDSCFVVEHDRKIRRTSVYSSTWTGNQWVHEIGFSADVPEKELCSSWREAVARVQQADAARPDLIVKIKAEPDPVDAKIEAEIEKEMGQLLDLLGMSPPAVARDPDVPMVAEDPEGEKANEL